MQKKISRRKAIIRRRIFLSACCIVLAVAIALVGFVVKSALDTGNDVSSDSNSDVSSVDSSGVESQNSSDSSDMSSEENNSRPQFVDRNGVTLDAEFEMLLLVNADNPLPDDYDANIRASLVEIDPKYRNNNYVTQIHKDVYPYITAMVAAAQADGVGLKVWSPFRSYAIQKDLFRKQVDRVGGDEAKAATVVARPGTSEHNTGLCADFNMASDAFEKTDMYRWMTEHAADYGFVMRYSEEKQPLTGVIHESWHWRFVGIYAAHEMNELGMCLEEYVEYRNK